VFTSSIGASDINDRGQIVGTTTVNGQLHATLWRHATATDLGVGEAIAINRWGGIVGFLPNPQGGFNSGYATVMWTRSTHRTIESRITTPGWTLTGLGGINADGQIAGNGHLNGAPKAFLLVPTG
jgi:probable HAF family extracellular repeat protein